MYLCMYLICQATSWVRNRPPKPRKHLKKNFFFLAVHYFLFLRAGGCSAWSTQLFYCLYLNFRCVVVAMGEMRNYRSKLMCLGVLDCITLSEFDNYLGTQVGTFCLELSASETRSDQRMILKPLQEVQNKRPQRILGRYFIDNSFPVSLAETSKQKVLGA